MNESPRTLTGAGNCYVMSPPSITCDLLTLLCPWTCCSYCGLVSVNLVGKYNVTYLENTMLPSLTSIHFIWGNTYLIPAVCWILSCYPWAAVNLAENKACKWKYTENSHCWVREEGLTRMWRVSTFKEWNSIGLRRNCPHADNIGQRLWYHLAKCCSLLAVCPVGVR